MTRPASDLRPRIGVDLTRAGADTAWPALVREAAALAPELALQAFVAPAQRRLLDTGAAGPAVPAVVVPPGLPAAWRWPRLQRQWRLDLLHLDGVAPWWAGGAWSTSLHQLPQGRSLRRVAGARFIGVPSRWAGERLVHDHGVDPARVAVVPPGVDAVRFRPGSDGRALVHALGLEPNGYLCCVARRDARKLPLTLLEALAHMPRPRPTLVLIGREEDPAHRLALEIAVQRLGLAADVRLLDHITDTQLPALLRHARLFVQPSLEAHRGTAVLEAMASGVAVVTADVPVLAERVGRAGLTVHPHDSHELAAAMLCLLADPRRREALVQRGLARAQAHHWRGVAERLVEGWRDAVARPAPLRSPAWA
jgi:glycosyltransferase involved in cell wall biosynthesis